MTAKQLPDRPNLDQLKRQAKDLLRLARGKDADALARFRALPSLAHSSDEALTTGVALHDAQSVIAREYGFDAWNALVRHVEALALSAGVAVDEFIEAATDGRTDRAERLLLLHPDLVRANFHAALLLGNADVVLPRLASSPALATERGGPRGWAPLHYVCYTSVARSDPAREAGLVQIARALLSAGANANLQFPWLHHGVNRPVLWGAVMVVRSLTLAEVLLQAGANASDGVTLPLAASAGDLPTLDLLLAHGVDVNRPWATDGSAPLYAILHWSRTDAGVRWLIEHGAEPDPVFAGTGETPLHIAAASWPVGLVETLVSYGADISRRRPDGRTPYAIAELNGNRAVADWLLAQGAPSDLSPIDRLVAACSRGDRPTVDAMLRSDPDVGRAISPEHYAAFYNAAERNDTAALEAMLVAGFDPNRGDESIGKTALHAAAMDGWPDAVRVLLAHGASVTVRDREFKAQPLIWAAEGSRTSREGRDHAAVARLLLDAGSPVDWEQGEEPSESIVEIVNQWVAAKR